MKLDLVISPLLAAGVLHPVAILSLCVLAGVGTILLLPGKRETSWRKIGGVILLAALLIFVAMILRHAEAFSFGDMYFWLFSAIAILSAVRVITHPKPVYSALYFVLTVLASAGLFILLWAEFMAVALVLIYAGAILITYVFVIMLASQAQTSSPGTETPGAEYDRVSRDPAIAAAVGFALMGMIIFLIFEKAPVDPIRASTATPTTMQGGFQAGDRLVGFEGDFTKLQLDAALGRLPEKIEVIRDGKLVQVDTRPQPKPVALDEVQELAKYLFSQQIVTLELAGLLLTVAMVGAVIIARRQVAGQVPEHGEAIAAGIGPADRFVAPGTPVDDNPHSIPVYGTRNPQSKAFPET